MFIDEVKIIAKAGHGGKGCIAFLREKFRPKGGPIGGNGGRGGNVILRASHDINNLVAQFYSPHLMAQNGLPGQGKGMEGKAGKDLLAEVPCGTVVWKLTTPTSSGVSAESSAENDDAPRERLRQKGGAVALEIDLEVEPQSTIEAPSEPNRELVADLIHHGQELVLCQGGRGGRGNKNFATSTRQAPRFAQPGEPGEEGEFVLELKIMADVGLVGYPNAGKSTLLNAISRAKPKIAPYPFTTLHPQIGIVEYEDYHRATVCDIPGLIEGAHQNVGLGHAFLRHVQRCNALVVVVDMAGQDGRDPWEDYSRILNELNCYDPDLAAKPHWIAANKMDEPAARENLKTFRKHVGNRDILPIAAAFDQGMDAFKLKLRGA